MLVGHAGGTQMAEMLYPDDQRMEVVRKQILVLHSDVFLTDKERQELVDKVRKEMKGGLVFLPPSVTAITVDEDCIALLDCGEEET